MTERPGSGARRPRNVESKGLSQAHADVAHAFFALPESRGFVIAGGAALIARGVVERHTDGLDLFTDPTGDVPATAAALEAETR